MIKNERQYRITKAQAKKFASALNELSQRTGIDPLLRQLEEDALKSQLQELQDQIQEYEQLKSGSGGALTVDSFDQLPRVLVQARIAAGLSQKDLADRLGLKEQQIQRYESTDYASASLSRIQDVVKVLGIKVCKHIFVPTNVRTASVFLDRLRSLDLDHDFVQRRIIPTPIAERLRSEPAKVTEADIRHAATRIGRVFDWRVEDILGSERMALPTEAVGMARFKLPGRADERRLNAYTVYAHFLALLVLEATPQLSSREVPVDAAECRQAILSRHNSVTFGNALTFVWNLGIPVLPLSDRGAFHGACWRVNHHNVIVLKQRTTSLARWLHDLLRELYHAGQEPEAEQRAIIEEGEMSPDRRESDEEVEASVYAGDVMLGGRAEELAQKCVQAAGGSVERLKAVVPKVAAREHVEVDALANYMAFRLSLQNTNWWGAATTLQKTDSKPWEIARDFLLPRLSLERLNEVDRQLLVQALTTTED